MFKIDTGKTDVPVQGSFGPTEYDDGLRIDLSDWVRADRFKRKTLDAIWAVGSIEDLDAVMKQAEWMLDALHLNHPEMGAEITESEDDVRRGLTQPAPPELANANPRPAVPGSTAKKENAMFTIDTNTGGPKGPFLNYKQRAGQGMGDGTWYLRSKEGESDWQYTDMTDVMKAGIVADVFATDEGTLGGSLQLGYIKFNEGSAPDRHIWASPMASEQRRSEEKNGMGGGYIWQNLASFRVAVGGGDDALMEVSGWGAYKGIMSLIDQMNAGFAGNIGKCPMFQYTGFRTEGSGSKRMHVPEFVIAKWVDRPDCLKADTPVIGGAAPAPAPAQNAEAPAATGTPAPAGAHF